MAKSSTTRHRYEEDRPLSPELNSAIGALVVAWGHLEDNASVLAARLLRANHYDFRGVATNLGTTGKFDALSAIADIMMPARKARTIRAIAKQAKGWIGERNRIIHGSWYPTNKANIAQRYSYSARGELKQSDETVSVDRIMGFVRDVSKLRRRLNYALSREGFYKPKPRASP